MVWKGVEVKHLSAVLKSKDKYCSSVTFIFFKTTVNY